MKNKNNTKMEMETTIKHGDFTLTHSDYRNSYFLFYKDIPIWESKFNKLFGIKFRDYIFEREPDPKKAAEFLTELYNWGFSQPGALVKILGEEYK